MKAGMTNVDVAALAAELVPRVVGARVDRAYQPAKEQILLRLRRKATGRVDLLFELGKFVTATKRPPENPDKPSMVAQILRTELENGRVIAFAQIGFDRLIRMDIERGDGVRSLVFELFGDGNLLLLDAAGVITLPMKGGDFGARRLRKGEPYLPPPGAALPFTLTIDALRAAAVGKRDLVRFLAVDLGFGPLWGEELALRSGVAKNTPVADLADADWATVHGAVAQLGTDIQRNDLAPSLVYAIKPEGPELVDAVPFPMRRYAQPAFSHEEAPTFHEALDAIFVGGPATADEEELEDPRRPRFNEAKAKLLRQVKQVEDAMAAFDVEEAASRADGETLYAAFPQVQSILDALQKARGDRSWAAIEDTLAKGRAEGNPLALQVPQLRPHDGSAVIAVRALDGSTRDVEVDLRRTVQENADACFAAAKRAHARRAGAQHAQLDARTKIDALDAKGLDGFGAAPQRTERVSRHFWFESYRWTILPSGLIAVGGRSASQNDAVVKKYLRDGDRYVHAEIHGAPSIVVRPAEGVAKDISNEDLRVACQFAVCASRAWRQFGPATAYWVTPNQVSKTPASGEYVPRGAWMIHGKRNVESDLPMDWWIGKVRFRLNGTPIPKGEAAADERTVEKLVGGPRAGLAPFAARLLHVTPGPIEPSDAAQDLVERFGVTNEEAAAVVPAGAVQFLEETGGSGTAGTGAGIGSGAGGAL